MIYKTNYELYVRELHTRKTNLSPKSTNNLKSRPSIDSRRSPPPDELLSPLASLYPHVAALQPQYDPNSCTFTGYRHTGYWAAAYTTQPLEEQPMLTRRGSGASFSPTCIFLLSQC